MKHLQKDLDKANTSLEKTQQSLIISEASLDFKVGQINGAITQWEERNKHGNTSTDSLIKALRQLSAPPTQTAAGLVAPPSMPAPGPASPAAAAPSASVHDELEKICDQIRNIDGVRRDKGRAVNEDFARPYKMGLQGDMPSELPAPFLARLADADKEAGNEYTLLEPQIREARDAALAHLHLTPTQAAADTAQFQEANREAEKLTSPADIKASNLNYGRYERIVDYLSHLADQVSMV